MNYFRVLCLFRPESLSLWDEWGNNNNCLRTLALMENREIGRVISNWLKKFPKFAGVFEKFFVQFCTTTTFQNLNAQIFTKGHWLSHISKWIDAAPLKLYSTHLLFLILAACPICLFSYSTFLFHVYNCIWHKINEGWRVDNLIFA